MNIFAGTRRLTTRLITLSLLFVAATGSAAGLPSGQQVHVQSPNTGHYLVAEGGGGGDVHIDRVAAGPWETFTLVVEGGGSAADGSRVRLRTWSGSHYVAAQLGGGHGVDAVSTNDGPWETFTLVRLAGPGTVDSGDLVALRADNGQYVVAEGGGVNANRDAIGAWESFVLLAEGAPPPGSGVLPGDTELVPPRPAGAVLGTITGYEMNAPCPFNDPAKCELPLYSSYDRDTPEFWDVLVEELLHSRVNVVMAHGRGCFDAGSGDGGNGNMCPRLLRHMVAAIDRAGARGVIRLGMFDDTGAYPGTRNAVLGLPSGTRFDLADQSSWRFFWDHNMRIWFDTVPRDLWYRLAGRPVVAFWSLADELFSNQNGNASRLLRDLRQKFIARYGENPHFNVDGTWVAEDPAIITSDVQGVNDWFNPSLSNFTYRTWNGQRWGAVVPAFRDPDTYPGCGASCREFPRLDGQSLRSALDNGATARFTLLEGWTNVAESAGFYRSAAWRYPNQYINIVREYADVDTASLRFETEAADAFLDGSGGNAGGAYRPGDLDVGGLPGSGWFVGWTEGGEWLRFNEVKLACGTYRLTARVASPFPGQGLRLSIGGQSAGAFDVPQTGAWDSYQLMHLGTVSVGAGRYDLRLDFETGGINVDWFFLRKSAGC